MSLKVTYIGHATTLIEWNGFNILTDPVFSERVLCFKRKTPLAFDPAQLPKLNAIVISHAHYDHLDLFSFKYIPSDVPIFVPQGLSQAIAPFVKNTVVELATWARFPLEKNLGLCAVPAKHPGGRFLIPLRYRLCHGFVFSSNNEHLYFAGDTSYGDHFSKICSLFPLKLALLPLARSRHTFLTQHRHLDQEGFVKAWEDLGKPDCIPYHWGAFFGWGTQESAFQTLSKTMGDKWHRVNPGEAWTTT